VAIHIVCGLPMQLGGDGWWEPLNRADVPKFVKPVKLPPPREAGEWLTTCQSLVGGFVELVPLCSLEELLPFTAGMSKGDVFKLFLPPIDLTKAPQPSQRIYMLVDEDGIAMQRRANLLASNIWGRCRGYPNVILANRLILGDVVIAAECEVEGVE
jgi:hypothetical protein